jgi:phosphoribosylaminoimidazole (AIR) synthetase
MFRTFNMGVGMIVVCSAGEATSLQQALQPCYEIGRVTKGEKVVSLV